MTVASPFASAARIDTKKLSPSQKNRRRTAAQQQEQLTGSRLPGRQRGERTPGSRWDHCSAFFKAVYTADGRLADVFATHTTWFSYSSSALRTLKTYNFETTVTFSSYPGFAWSSVTNI